MIIDCHTHIGKFGGVVKNIKGKTAEDLIASMDIAQIDLSFIIANNLKGFGGTDSWKLFKVVSKFPDRLRMIANFDFSRIGDVGYKDKLLKLLNNELVVGLKFYPGYQEYDLCDELITPFYEFCQKSEIPIVIHTGYLLEEAEEGMECSHPRIISPLAKKFSKLVIIAAHFGNPYVEECGVVMKENENVYADISGYFTEFEPISSEEKNSFIKDIRKLKKSAGGLEKCIFGTDWWIYPQKEYKDAVELLSLSKREKELIFYKNSQSIFLKYSREIGSYQNNKTN